MYDAVDSSVFAEYQFSLILPFELIHDNEYSLMCNL